MFSFSFDSYDFGKCLVQKEETQYYSTILKFHNSDAAPIMYDFKNFMCIVIAVTF